MGQEMFKAQLSSKSVTEECQQNQQKVKGRMISVLDTPGLTTNKHIKVLVEQFKGSYSVFSNTDEENQSHVTKLIEKMTEEEKRGHHYTNEMYEIAQRRRVAEEEKPGEEKPPSLAQKAAFVGAGVVGGVIGAAGAVVGGAAHGAIGLVAAPVALIAAGVALMAEGGAITITHALQVCKEQKRNSENST